MDISSILNSFEFEKYGEKTRIAMTTLFKVCSKYKCKKIGVCKRDSSFSESHTFNNFDWLFIDGKYDNWPVVWKVAEEVDKELSTKFNEYQPLKRGCGNGGSYQINSTYVVPGIYENINNKWIKTN